MGPMELTAGRAAVALADSDTGTGGCVRQWPGDGASLLESDQGTGAVFSIQF
eukprot:CAMPEP_0117663148 /NCGR_PEP_ID=MMETSP0804-20121206/8438_1 /TAXON_ID=1074897 /ORGANISM="Tetraselmis astigmatica, Strain CCMP880" /LENGTH=51 /DNA_ID=CAMNT_0005470107 /DNA_START=107 /DNA_END=262 /DNA_ORIENTATION=+